MPRRDLTVTLTSDRFVLESSTNSRCGGAWLPDGGVTADKVESEVPEKDGVWEVEGGDDEGDAEWTGSLHEEVVVPLRGDDLAGEHPREADGVVADVDGLLDLSAPLLEDLAHLERDEGSELVLVLLERVTDLEQDLAPLRSRDVPPHLVRRVGMVDDGRYVFGAGLCWRAERGGKVAE